MVYFIYRALSNIPAFQPSIYYILKGIQNFRMIYDITIFELFADINTPKMMAVIVPFFLW